MKKITLIFVFALSVLSVFAQQSYTLFNMPRIHQSIYVNPAQLPMGKVNVGFPLISSIYFNISNSGFKGKDLFVKGSDDSLYIKPGNVIKKLSKNNYLSTSIQLDYISFGFRLLKRHYISFNATEKVLFRFRYPKDFMQFVWEGNGADEVIGKELSFNFGVDLMHYREYGLGYALQINEKLSLGLRLKYLYGMENIKTHTSDVKFKTDENTFAITASSDIKIQTSGMDSGALEDIDFNGYFFGKKNTGYGLDLGLHYRPIGPLNLELSVVDLGFIKWKDQVSTYQSANPGASFTFDGIGLNQFVSDSTSLDDAFDQMLDSVSNLYRIETIHETYSTSLSTQFYIGATFDIFPKLKFGALYHSQFYDKVYHPGFSLSLTALAGRWLSAGVTYSILNRSINNFGFGFGIKSGPLQLYAVSDNVLGMFLPMAAKNLNVRAGINLTFGKEEDFIKIAKMPVPIVPRKRGALDTDLDGVPDLSDECPDVFGLVLFAGCPDTDNDSVPDKLDECPTIFGLKTLRGCPDRDFDDIPDMRDSCPDAFGLSEFYGCPDSDKDGIEDRSDDCPAVAGLKIFNGCPDTDGDGISDSKDNCPERAGPLKFNGCPDTDGDGIVDSKDDCPDRAGPLSFKGCPDSDLDGVPDPEDDCPDTYGSKDNRGCPKVKVVEKFQSAALTVDEQVILKEAFDGLVFQSGKTSIASSSLPALEMLSEMMVANNALKLHITGHTDNVGNANSNLKLSQNRAKAVKEYLASQGVDGSRISTEGFGSSRPIADNTSTEGKASNRRVELKIIK